MFNFEININKLIKMEINTGGLPTEEVALHRESMEAFHKLILKLDHLKTNEEFINFRRSVIYLICNKIKSVLKCDILCCKLLNIIHPALLIFYKMKEKIEDFKYTFEPYFSYIFYSAIFLICKYSDSQLFSTFKNIAVTSGHQLIVIFNLEPLILDSIDWNINTVTIFELSDIIFHSVLKLDATQLESFTVTTYSNMDTDNHHDHSNNSIKQNFRNYVLFALEEFAILLTYGQYKITLAAISIVLKHFELANELVILEAFIKEINEDDFEMVEKCEHEVLTSLDADEEQADITNQIHSNITGYNTDENQSLISNTSILSNKQKILNASGLTYVLNNVSLNNANFKSFDNDISSQEIPILNKIDSKTLKFFRSADLYQDGNQSGEVYQRSTVDITKTLKFNHSNLNLEFSKKDKEQNFKFSYRNKDKDNVSDYGFSSGDLYKTEIGVTGENKDNSCFVNYDPYSNKINKLFSSINLMKDYSPDDILNEENVDKEFDGCYRASTNVDDAAEDNLNENELKDDVSNYSSDNDDNEEVNILEIVEQHITKNRKLSQKNDLTNAEKQKK